MQPPETLFNKKLMPLFLLAAVTIVAVIGLIIWQKAQFRIVSTTPNLESVAAIAPELKITFNRSLSPQASISVDANVRNGYTVSDKSVTVRFQGPLTVGRTYTITLKEISSTNGEKIQNKALRFTAKDIPLQQLPQDQQKAIIQQQTSLPKPYRERLAFNGTEELIRQGLSTDQVSGFEQAIFNYSDSIKKEFTAVTIDTSSVRTGPSPANDGNFSATFVVMLDQQKLNAQLDYSGLSTVRLRLSDTNSHQVFDSQAVVID